MARIAEIQQGLAPQGAAARVATAATGGALAPGSLAATGTPASFASVLGSQSVAPTATTASLLSPTGATAGQRALAAAQGEIGVTEQPPGSNDAPRIAQYRQATAGSGIGPWCAYFVSWAAQQAGAPLGESGQGFGSVSAVAAWAQRTGRWTPNAAGATPSPGDLIVWGGEHIGIVESVDPDGSIHTIEGNSSNMVTRRTHAPGGDGATGYVRLG